MMKLRILLTVADFANHAKFVLSGPAWAVYVFKTKLQGHQSLLLGALPGRWRAPYSSQTLNSKYWTVKQSSSRPRTADYLFHQAVDSWYFADVSALELTVEFHGLLRRVVLPRSDSLLHCTVPVDGVT